MFRQIVLLLHFLAIFAHCETIPHTNNPQICNSEMCAKDSTILKSYLDQTIDPCENFYEFACGKFAHEADLPDDKVGRSTFSKIQDKVSEQMLTVLTENPQPNEPYAFYLAKQFTNICINEKARNENGVKPLQEIFDKIGGWPVTKGDKWNATDWNLLGGQKQLFNHGLISDVILEFTVGPHYRNSSKRVLNIDRPAFGLSEKFLLVGLKHSKVKAYFTFMVDAAVIFGANRSNAERELHDTLQFETELAKISLSSEERRNISVTFNEYNIQKLQSEFPYLNWHDYISWNLNDAVTVDENDVIIVPDVNYLRQLNALLQKIPNRTVANYLAWRSVLFSGDLLDDSLHQRFDQYNADITGVRKSIPRLTECVKQTMNFLSISAAAIYVRKYFNVESKDMVSALANSIRIEFLEMLKNIRWMDENTRGHAIRKANAMNFHIGYPDELTNDDKLNEHYHGLKLQTDSIFHSTLRIRKFNQNQRSNEFRQPIDRNDWRDLSIRAALVNAFNIGQHNSIQMPAAILQDRFFSAERPSYMTYGTIGWIIGHEITHGFDDGGRQLDMNGNLVNWWQEDTLKEFTTRAKCFIDQYSNYKHPVLNLTVNSVITLGENIADVGGIKATYGAYQRYVQQNGPEPILPGMNYTANQLLWIAAAQNWCAVLRREYEIKLYATDEHAPHNYRVIGPFSSSTDFAKDFKCTPNTRMFPSQRCEIW